MKRPIFAFFLYLSSVAMSFAADKTECKAIAMQMINIMGAQYVRTSGIFENIFLYLPGLDDLTVMCGPGKPSISISKDGEITPYVLAMGSIAANIISGQKDRDALKKIALCIKRARMDGFESANISTRYVNIDSQSFLRDGGGTNFEISKTD